MAGGFRGFFGAPAPGALLPLVGPERHTFTVGARVLFFLPLVLFENVVVVIRWSGQTGKDLGPVNKLGTPVLRKARDERVRYFLSSLVLKSIPVTKAKKKNYQNINRRPIFFSRHLFVRRFKRKVIQGPLPSSSGAPEHCPALPSDGHAMCFHSRK